MCIEHLFKQSVIIYTKDPQPVALNYNPQHALTACIRQGMLGVVVLQKLEPHRLGSPACRNISETTSLLTHYIVKAFI